MKNEQEEGERWILIESGERARSSRAGQPRSQSCHQRGEKEPVEEELLRHSATLVDSNSMH